MKLSRLYSNKPNLFEPINFTQELNVILAEIRLPENLDKDTHNLGKTTLGRLIDFMFLLKRDKNFFLFKHIELFKSFTFFLELQTLDASFLTIKRSVSNNTKISFKRHPGRHGDFVSSPAAEWDHFQVPIDRARKILDGLLDLQALKPWNYRKGIGFQLRSQDDFRDVFKLTRFAGSHSDWKPFVAHILGFDANLIELHYRKEDELKSKVSEEDILKKELGDSDQDISRIEGLLLLKQDEVDKKQEVLDAFDFRAPDIERTEQLVDNIDEQISSLNARRYSLRHNRKKILEALNENQILFRPNEAQRLFEEAGIIFQGQIVRDFEQLIAFNQSITDERYQYLQEEYSDIESELNNINQTLEALGRQRSEMLSFLSETDIFEKYKKVSDEIVILKADITSLNRKRGSLSRLQELRNTIRGLQEERTQLHANIEFDVDHKTTDKTSLFSLIRLSFNEIVEEVIDRKALLRVAVNNSGHLDFKAEILDESGNTTSADLGHTYRKLLCVAFDLAILRAHIDQNFSRFVYHDGVFESLDDRKKENLLTILERYTNMGIQSVITSIDSDLPIRNTGQGRVFDDSQIVLTLHDQGDEGRLFKMRAW
ncbi:MAG: DUF2326 domain-containing protein [Leptolyngbyaceae cyanobacterium]